MKKIMIVLAVAITLTACGSGAEGKKTSADTTAVKTDSTEVDSVKVETTTVK